MGMTSQAADKAAVSRRCRAPGQRPSRSGPLRARTPGVGRRAERRCPRRDGCPVAVSRDVEVVVSGVLDAAGDDLGVGQHECPVQESGGVVDGRGDIADDVEPAADPQQDGQFSDVLGARYMLCSSAVITVVGHTGAPTRLPARCVGGAWLGRCLPVSAWREGRGVWGWGRPAGAWSALVLPARRRVAAAISWRLRASEECVADEVRPNRRSAGLAGRVPADGNAGREGWGVETGGPARRLGVAAGRGCRLLSERCVCRGARGGREESQTVATCLHKMRMWWKGWRKHPEGPGWQGPNLAAGGIAGATGGLGAGNRRFHALNSTGDALLSFA